MEFSLFAHMERLTPEQPHDVLYEEFIGLCQVADQGGMRAIWTGEHHGMNFTIAPNPFLNLIDVARHTKSVRLGTGTIVAPFWHTIRLAGEAAMADIITQGRLDLGVAFRLQAARLFCQRGCAIKGQTSCLITSSAFIGKSEASKAALSCHHQRLTKGRRVEGVAYVQPFAT